MSIQKGGGSTKEEISLDHRQHRQNTRISDTSKYLTTKEKTEFNSATRLTFHQVSQPIDNISQNRLFCHTQAEELIRNPDLPLTNRNSTGCKMQNVLIINTHFNRNNRKKACIKDEISNMQLKWNRKKRELPSHTTQKPFTWMRKSKGQIPESYLI